MAFRHGLSRKPIEMRQLTAMAAMLIKTDPTMDDSEWLHRLKCELLAQGFTYPQPWTLMAGAIARVTAIHRREWGGDRPPSPRPFRRSPVARPAADLGDLNLRWSLPEHLSAIRKVAGTDTARAAIERAEQEERVTHHPHEW